MLGRMGEHGDGSVGDVPLGDRRDTSSTGGTPDHSILPDLGGQEIGVETVP